MLATVPEPWKDLESRLRPFIAKRVPVRADVDDIVQDVFVRLRRGLAQVRNEERFGPWMFQVARSAIGDHRRKSVRHPWSEPSCEKEAVAEEPEDDAAEQMLAMAVAPFIASLPSPYREALTLTELEGLTQKQAAEMLGVSLSGMKSRVQRGRERLREALEQCCKIGLDARGKVVSCEPRPDGRIPDCDCTSQPIALGKRKTSPDQV
jgi:RNA polymerase sigma-70 factor (ECF subfamily)